MLVNQWAENYWSISTVAAKTLFDYKGIYRREIQPVIGEMDLNEVTLLDIQKMVIAQKPYSARLSLMLVKTLYIEARVFGVTEKNPTIGVKLPKRPEPKRKFLTWDQVNALDWGKYNEQVRFLALQGLRWSEAVALTEKDIVDGYVTVNKSFYGNQRDVQVALWVGLGHQGRGIGQWIVTVLEWYAFHVFGYDHAYYQYDATNRKSGKLPQILGYRFSHSFDQDKHAVKESGLWLSWVKDRPQGLPDGVIDTGNWGNWGEVTFPWKSLI